MKIAPVAAAIASMLPLSVAVPAEPSSPPAALNALLLREGYTIEKHFSAISNLTGWVVKRPDGQYDLFYTTADGQSLLAGLLVTSSGENLTQRYAELHFPKPDLSALWAEFENAHWIATGQLESPKSVIYAILDPNCIFCHYLYLAVQPYEEVGLQVRWIPVGVLHADSANKAAAILKDGAWALHAQQAKYGAKEMPKGIEVTPEFQASLNENQELMGAAQINVTPGLVYKNAAGKVIKKTGLPRLSELPVITGLPAQKHTEPALERFK